MNQEALEENFFWNNINNINRIDVQIRDLYKKNYDVNFNEYFLNSDSIYKDEITIEEDNDNEEGDIFGESEMFKKNNEKILNKMEEKEKNIEKKMNYFFKDALRIIDPTGYLTYNETLDKKEKRNTFSIFKEKDYEFTLKRKLFIGETLAGQLDDAYDEIEKIRNGESPEKKVNEYIINLYKNIFYKERTCLCCKTQSTLYDSIINNMYCNYEEKKYHIFREDYRYIFIPYCLFFKDFDLIKKKNIFSSILCREYEKIVGEESKYIDYNESKFCVKIK